jgi:hypothetical protein
MRPAGEAAFTRRRDDRSGICASARRLGTLIEDSAAGRRLAQMSNARKKE